MPSDDRADRASGDAVATGSSDRAFGLVFAAVFAAIGFYPWLGGHGVRPWALAVAGGLVAVAAVVPAVLAPLNRAWQRVGHAMHVVTTPLILALIFFVVITPMGLLMRALGKDPLRLRRAPGAASYWIERRDGGPKPESFTDQF